MSSEWVGPPQPAVKHKLPVYYYEYRVKRPNIFYVNAASVSEVLEILYDKHNVSHTALVYATGPRVNEEGSLRLAPNDGRDPDVFVFLDRVDGFIVTEVNPLVTVIFCNGRDCEYKNEHVPSVPALFKLLKDKYGVPATTPIRMRVAGSAPFTGRKLEPDDPIPITKVESITIAKTSDRVHPDSYDTSKLDWSVLDDVSSGGRRRNTLRR